MLGHLRKRDRDQQIETLLANLLYGSASEYFKGKSVVFIRIIYRPTSLVSKSLTM